MSDRPSPPPSWPVRTVQPEVFDQQPDPDRRERNDRAWAVLLVLVSLIALAVLVLRALPPS